MTLVEQLVILGVVGLALAAAMTGVSTAAIGLTTSRSSNEAVNLAAAQIEYAKSQPFTASATSYPLGVSAPQGVTVFTEAQPVLGADTNVQRVVVTVVKGGKTLATMESLKVNRP